MKKIISFFLCMSFFHISLNQTHDLGNQGLLNNVAQKVSVSRSHTTSFSHGHLDWLKNLAIYLPLFIVALQQYLKRIDDKRTLKLERINSQLKDLYGPLYAWQEIGHANFISFIRSGHQSSFTDPDYVIWLKEVFIRTNNKMESIIINNSDLFVSKIPTECILFCKHVAAMKTCLAELNKMTDDYALLKTLDNRMTQHKHPGDSFRAYIIQAFKILKQEQSNRLLNNNHSSKFRNESELYDIIEIQFALTAKILEKTGLFNQRNQTLPYASNSKDEELHRAKIIKSKIRYEKIYEYKFYFGIPAKAENFETEEILEYNKEGYQISTEIKNNSGHEILSIINSFTPQGFKKDSKILTPDKLIFADVKFIFKDGRKIETKSYDSSRKLDFKIGYKFDENGQEILYEKFDESRKLLEKVSLVDVKGSVFNYIWYDPKTRKEIKKSRIVKNKLGNIEERIDIDSQGNEEYKMKWIYTYDEEGFLIQSVQIGNNGEEEILKNYIRVKFDV